MLSLFWLMLSPIDRWEFIQYIGASIVLLGVIGEGLIEFDVFHNDENSVSKLCVAFIGFGLAIELIGSVRAYQLFDSDLASIRSEAAQANERASINEKEAATLRKLAENERTARLKVEATFAWRRLTKEQQVEIGSKLKQFNGEDGRIYINNADNEAFTFASDIASALRMAHWTVLRPPTPSFFANGPTSTLPSGVIVRSSKDRFSIRASDALMWELEHAGFECTKEPELISGPESHASGPAGGPTL